jgi:hypothetical protein
LWLDKIPANCMARLQARDRRMFASSGAKANLDRTTGAMIIGTGIVIATR